MAGLIAGEVDADTAAGAAATASQRGMPTKIVAVTLYRPLFWLVTKPEYKSVAELKGTTLGITSLNGIQHRTASHLLRRSGLDPAKTLLPLLSVALPCFFQPSTAARSRSRRFPSDHYCGARQVQNENLGRAAQGRRRPSVGVFRVGKTTGGKKGSGAKDPARPGRKLTSTFWKMKREQPRPWAKFMKLELCHDRRILPAGALWFHEGRHPHRQGR